MVVKSCHITVKKTVKKKRPKSRYQQTCLLLAIILAILITTGIIIAYLFGTFDSDFEDEKELEPPNPLTPLPASRSPLKKFNKAAVCADAAPCAQIGTSILKQNGSAVDAAIATMFCTGIFSMQNMGLGGGFFMTIYIKENQTAYSVNAQEVAPMNANEEIFDDDPLLKLFGPLAVCVPGELSGYWEAHQRFGKLPWKDLVQPTVELCENGFNITEDQYLHTGALFMDDLLKQWFWEPDERYKKVGSLVKPEPYCKTLKIIAEKGAEDFYTGTISKLLLEDIEVLGGIITAKDLANYRAKIEEPIKFDLNNGDKLFSTPPPGSGLLLGFIMNILAGYGFNPKSIDGIENTVVTYHRIIEAFKYAFAKRTKLGDPDFVDLSELIKNLTSTDYANAIRKKIKDNATRSNPKDYEAVFHSMSDHGAAHLSVLAENGDAVSVTSSLNSYFGAKLTSKQTGIILNSGMDDFSFSNILYYLELRDLLSNVMVPTKRPLSSMAPSIVVDRNGDVKMVIGASEGPKIISTLAMIIMRSLWFGQTLKEAIDEPRFHHQTIPMVLSYEYGVISPIVERLEALGHETSRQSFPIYGGSIVRALMKINGTIYGNADYRKEGDVSGFD